MCATTMRCALQAPALVLLLGSVPAWAESGAPASGEVVVLAAGFFRTAEGCGGGTSPVQIQMEPNPRPQIQIGFFESSAGAIGEQSRAAGWMAALVSTTVLERDLSAYQISFSRADRVDGPSAGALMTSGLLALLRGEAFPADASMTGTINPDGTVGPVGGIGSKIQGASRSKMKRFGVPLGQRLDINPCTGEQEDVVAIGQSLGVQVVEIGDIREAYAFLTGAALPEAPTRPVDDALPERHREAYRKLFMSWAARYEAAGRTVAQAQPAHFPPELRTFWEHAATYVRTGQGELDAGHESAAFNRIWMGVVNAEFVARGVRALQALLTQGYGGLHALVQAELAETAGHVDAQLLELEDLYPDSVVDAGAITAIGSHLASAFAFREQATEELRLSVALGGKGNPADAAEVVRLAFEALGYLSLVGPLVDVAVATTSWVEGEGPALGEPAPIVSAISLYESAALSNLRYVDTLYTALVAEQQQADIATTKSRLRRQDPTYLAAAGALEQLGNVDRVFADDYAAALARLGALMGVVSTSALLVAQHYSLGARTDAVGRVVGFRNEPALARMTELAEREALRAIGEADVATGGASTPMLLVALDAARRNRDVTTGAGDRLMALSLFWGATLNARLITRLARAD